MWQQLSYALTIVCSHLGKREEFRRCPEPSPILGQAAVTRLGLETPTAPPREPFTGPEARACLLGCLPSVGQGFAWLCPRSMVGPTSPWTRGHLAWGLGVTGGAVASCTCRPAPSSFRGEARRLTLSGAHPEEGVVKCVCGSSLPAPKWAWVVLPGASGPRGVQDA